MKLKKNFISCFLLFAILCQFFIPTFVKADIGYTQNQEGVFPTDFTEIDGLIRNYKNQPIDYKEAIVSKKASRGDKDGEFYIDLRVEGKTSEEERTKDIVVVLDNSNSMKLNNRVTIAKDTLTTFVKNVLRDGNGKVRVALVTYGSDVFDGREVDEFYYKGDMLDRSHKTFTTNPQDIISKIPSKVPEEYNYTNTNGFYYSSIGATFTQAALREAAKILKDSSANDKIIVHLTDGVPTVSNKISSIDRSGKANFDYSIAAKKGSGHTFFLKDGAWIKDSYYPYTNRYYYYEDRHKPYDVNNAQTGRQLHVENHGVATYYEAKEILKKYSVYTVGIELTDTSYDDRNRGYGTYYPEGTIPRDDILKLMTSISTSPRHYYDSASINQLSDILAQIERDIRNTVVNGKVIDPIGDMVQLNLTSPKITASEDSILNTIDLDYNQGTKTFTINGLNLGRGQWVNLRYKVNIKTEDPNYKSDFFYPANGKTDLIPVEKTPNIVREFPVPSVKAHSIDVNVQKVWKYKNGKDLPDSMKKEIKVKLIRTSTNPDVEETNKVKEIGEKTLNKAGDWKATFEKLIPFDNLGYHFEYTVKEVALEGFESKIEYSNNKNFIKSENGDVTITNTKNIEVEFFKYKTENGQKIPISDIEFELYKKNALGRYEVVTNDGKNVVVKSGADGKFKFDSLEVGEYAIKEIKAPEGYRTPKNFVRTFEITSEGKVKYENAVYNSDDTFYNIENIKYPQMYFMFRKLDTNGELIKQGILELQLKGPKDKTLSFDLTKSTNDGFKFEIPEDFPTGDYVLTEKTAPMGYQKSNVEYHIRIDAENRTITLVKEVKGSVETQKNIVLYQDNDGAIDTIKHDIKNDKTVYPHTGGTGVVPFVLSGLFVMLCAGSVYILKKKRAM
ncbi:SpaA isopeptide-forming pilin-related protein [Parvimonas micra]